MIQSTELKELILQWYKDLSVGNSDSTDRLFSTKQAGFLGIGTDPDEWWHDPAVIKRRYRGIIKTGGIKVKVNNLEAYCEGSVGWVVGRVVYQLPNGSKISIRQSFILHQEDSQWKIVHAHGSMGVHNEDFGVQ